MLLSFKKIEYLKQLEISIQKETKICPTEDKYTRDFGQSSFSFNMGKHTKFPRKRYGGDSRSYKKVAHTQHDQRCTDATKINNGNNRCQHGNKISATQHGSAVTVYCDCGHEIQFTCKGCLDYNDALAEFHDTH